jgi:nucleotide-binding universal stress UspA family protein
MLRKILVPLDGSDLAERALTYATRIADRTGSEILLLRATTSHTMVGADPRERHVAEIREAREYLDQVATKLGAHGYVCETVARSGHAAECITGSARSRQADLIVMATHGRTGPGRWIFGSVAEAVVASSPVPVLVQSAWQPILGEPLVGTSPKLIVALDGSAFAETALDPAARLAEDLGGRLVLVRVEDDVMGVRAALGYLRVVQARLSSTRPCLSVETSVRISEPGEGIARAVARLDASLVVMATHGRTGLRRALAGSVSGKVLRECDIPVVLLRPATAEDDTATLPDEGAASAAG